MNTDEQAAWSDAVFDAKYLDLEVSKQLVPKFAILAILAILAADTELRALRAVAEAAREVCLLGQVQLPAPWLAVVHRLDSALTAAGYATNARECAP